MTEFSTHLELQQFEQHIRRMMDLDDDAREADEELWQQLCDNSDEEDRSTLRRPILHRIPNKFRNALAGHERFMSDYMNEDSVYNQADFELQRVFLLDCATICRSKVQHLILFNERYVIPLFSFIIEIGDWNLIPKPSPRTAQGDLVSQRLKKLHVRCDS